MIIGRAERLQLEIYPESGCVRSCYSYQTEILNSWYAKCPCNEEFTVLEKCGVIFTGQTHLNKGNSPFNLVDTLVFFNFRSEIHMATPYNALKNTRKSTNDFFFRPQRSPNACLKDVKKKKTDQTTEKTLCSSKLPNLVLTEITIILLNLTSRTDNWKPGFNIIWKGLWPSLTDSIRQIHFVRVLFHIIHF